MGAIEKIVQALANQVGPACQVVAICGRNKGLIKRLEAKQYPAGMQVTYTASHVTITFASADHFACATL